MKKWAAAMDMPEGKMPGYYAQVIKALAAQAVLFDRDKEVLVANSREELAAIAGVLDKYSIPWEELPLLLLPEGCETTPLFEDYGFVSVKGRAYLYAELARLFRFAGSAEGAGEPEAALLQMQEHLLARFAGSGGLPHYAVDAQLGELIEGIASAYGCRVAWLD